MGAGRIEALAPPVGEAAYARRAFEVREPGGEVAAGHVAVAGRIRPARGERERHRLVRRQPGRAHRLLKVQQAEIVLPPLAQHDAAAFPVRVGDQPVELAVDLVLEVAGKGRDPHGRFVLLRPEARRRQVAERLADPGAGLRDHHMRLARPLAGLERRRDRRGVVRLPGPVLGIRTQHVRKPPAGLLRLHRPVRGGGLRGEFGPDRQAFPDRETGPAGRPALRHAERGQHERPPEPAGFRRIEREIGGPRCRDLPCARVRPAGRAPHRTGSRPRVPARPDAAGRRRRPARSASAGRIAPGARRRRVQAGRRTGTAAPRHPAAWKWPAHERQAAAGRARAPPPRSATALRARRPAPARQPAPGSRPGPAHAA